MGLGSSRVATNSDPESKAKYVVDSLIVPIGGKSGSGTDKARLFLAEYQGALDEAGDVAPMFPLKTVEVQAMVSCSNAIHHDAGHAVRLRKAADELGLLLAEAQRATSLAHQNCKPICMRRIRASLTLSNLKQQIIDPLVI